MSGYKLVLPTSFTNNSLPFLTDDPMLNSGSLLLVEPAHPASTYRGNLADGDMVDNVAAKEAKRLIPTATDTALKARLRRNDGAGMWWSAKGNSIQWAGGNVSGLLFPDAIMSYIKANPTNMYRVSMWMGMVTDTSVSGRWSNLHFDKARDTNSYLFNMIGGTADSGGLDSNGNPTPNLNTFVGHRRHIAAGSLQGPNDATVTEAHAWSRIFGRIGENPGPAGGQAIFHRFYLEDTTVSKRTAAEFELADRQLYVKHMWGVGGRHTGETYVSK